MYPLLLEIPLPGWAIPLAAALGTIAALGAVLAVAAYRNRDRELAAVGALVAVAGAAAAISLRGSAYLPQAIVVTTYGALLAVALVVGWGLVTGLGSIDGIPSRTLEGAMLVAIGGGFVGARLDYVLQSPGVGVTVASWLDVGQGGFAFPGALLGGVVGAAVELRRRKAPLLSFADVAAPAVSLGIVLGHLGSYGMGSGYGCPLPVGTPRALVALGTFPRWDTSTLGGRGAPAWVDHVERGLVPTTASTSLPVHPVSLYFATAGLLLLAITIVVRHRRRFTGEVLLAFAFVEAGLRYPIEILRDDPERWLPGPRLPAAHALGLGLVVTAAAFVAGPSQAVSSRTPRRVSQVVTLLSACLTWAAMALVGVGDLVTELSFAQWTALATMVGVALAWTPLAKRLRPA
ncbi:MAG: prolipoprotein diacylglyceryl transferase [Polyangiaceae bacterium]|nr:prolipoprotein diacylglyceryl transferase [Polyangiaceae bacterium]